MNIGFIRKISIKVLQRR